MWIADMIVPLAVAGVLFYGFVKKVDIFGSFCEGAGEGLRTCGEILPALVLLVMFIALLKASGAVEALTGLLRPLCSAVSFPGECVPMVILRPFSGSGAIAVYDSIAAENGADSLAEKVAAVLIGSSETTFYTIAVYFSAVRVRSTRHAVPAALTADLTAWLVAGMTVVWLMNNG
ncbi:MAG: spore maturation protein [Oscillospiraceae bacterium]|nr:spore maturation protein [Oscillospiraceae bacterium]